MFDRIRTGWALAKASLEVLRLDKEMLVFPLCSGIACLLVLASFAFPLAGSEYMTVLQDEGQVPHDPIAYLILFAFYFVNYFVIVFFNSALVGCALIRFRGGDPTVSDGFQIAFSRLPQIFAWSLVSATVGTILKSLQSRENRIGQIIVGLIGVVWSIVTFFVVPVLVAEKCGPLEAIKRSASIMKRTWGETIVANFGIGLIVFLMMLAAFVPGILAFSLYQSSGSVITLVIGICISVFLVILLSLVSSALNVIMVAALYEYSRTEKAPGPFDAALMRNAFVAKG